MKGKDFICKKLSLPDWNFQIKDTFHLAVGIH